MYPLARGGVAQVYCACPNRSLPSLGPGPLPRGRCGEGCGPATPGPLLVSPQEAGKLEEVMQELQALRALVQEQGARIGRLEEQLGRIENGDA